MIVSLRVVKRNMLEHFAPCENWWRGVAMEDLGLGGESLALVDV
ncbi:MAG: hypothetical protein AAF591_19910 [Verrucomicrobiota bacterium]